MAEADSNQGRIATRKVGTARTKPFDAFDLLAFLIPCLRFIKVQVVGVLSGSDILLLLVFLYLVFSQKLKISANAGKRLLILCSLWFASQCLTDYVRHSVFKDYVRGWSNIGLTFVNLVVFWVLLYGNRKRLALYGWGLVCGTLLTVLVSPDEYMKDDPWKFGLAFTFTWATLLVASSKRCRASWAIGLAVMAA